MTFYLKNAPDLVKSVGYVAMPKNMYDAVLKRFEDRTVGTVYTGDEAKGKSLEQLYGAASDATDAGK